MLRSSMFQLLSAQMVFQSVSLSCQREVLTSFCSKFRSVSVTFSWPKVVGTFSNRSRINEQIVIAKLFNGYSYKEAVPCGVKVGSSATRPEVVDRIHLAEQRPIVDFFEVAFEKYLPRSIDKCM
jgi:hypothetical protein